MLPTPTTSHLTFTNIYEPSEDSYLLLDALSQPSEALFLHPRLSKGPVPLIAEIGTGSGVILAFVAANAAAVLGRPDVLTLGTDLNPFACTATTQTLHANTKPPTASGSQDASAQDPPGLFLAALNADLTAPLRRHCVDVLVFNPPYVPSESVPSPSPTHSSLSPSLSTHAAFERDSNLLALATDGGADGMEVTERLLARLPEVLDPDRGVAYVLLCARNRPGEVGARVRAWGKGWEAVVVRESGGQGGWERLQILRIARKGG